MHSAAALVLANLDFLSFKMFISITLLIYPMNILTVVVILWCTHSVFHNNMTGKTASCKQTGRSVAREKKYWKA